MPERLVVMFVLWLIIGVLTPFCIIAQTESTGAISGAVSDQSGAPIPGIPVEIILKNTGAVRKVHTSGTGSYIASLLAPGEYSVRVMLKEFQTVVLDPVVVRVTENTTADIGMKVGAGKSETVTVTAETPLINATTATKGEVIAHNSIAQLPLPTLNFQQLLTLSPGTSASLSNNTDLGRGDAYVSVNGQRMTSNNMTVPGTVGRITSTSTGPRVVQCALKYSF